MQSGGGGGRNPAGGRASTPSSASPSSSSSAVSTPQLGFDSNQQQQKQQQQQQQQQQSRQSLQQQLLRKPEGNEAFLAFQACGLQGMMGGSNYASFSGSIQLPQQARKFVDLAQQHGSPLIREESHDKSQAIEQQVLNPVYQAYLQYAFQAAQQKSALAMQSQQQAKIGMTGPKDQDMRMGNLKLQELMSMQVASQGQASSSKKSSDQFAGGEKQVDPGQHVASEQRNEPKALTQPMAVGQLMPSNILRPMQAPQPPPSTQNMVNSQLAMAAQLQALQAWALEHNIDLSVPANANLMAQLIPIMQSKMVAQHKPNDNITGGQSSSALVSKQQVASPVASDSSPHGNLSGDLSGQSGSGKGRQAVPQGPFGATAKPLMVNNTGQQFGVQTRDNQVPARQIVVTGNGMPPMHPPQPANVSQGSDHPFPAKNTGTGTENLQMQYLRQTNHPPPQSAVQSGDYSKEVQPQGGSGSQTLEQHFGFTKQQLHVLKAQILAFRRLKKGEGSLPQELLRAIAPPPLELQLQQLPASAGMTKQDRPSGKNVENHLRQKDTSEKDLLPVASAAGQSFSKDEGFTGNEKPTTSAHIIQGPVSVMKEPLAGVSTVKEEQQASAVSCKSDHEADWGFQKSAIQNDVNLDRGKAVASQAAASDAVQVKKSVQAGTTSQAKDAGSTRKYHGPLFDFPFFTRKHDSFGSPIMVNTNNNLTLAYDIKDLLLEEGMEVLKKKRTENLSKIGNLLAVNLERKRIRPDLVLRLQIEERKLRLLDLQARLRDEVDQAQQEIMAMPDRPYRKFVRQCERQRLELARQVQASQKAVREKQLKSIFNWRKKLLESHWAIRDARTARNRGVAKYHERMLREFSKRKDEDRTKRMEALKNNDVERYREMLMEQQTSIPGDAAERYTVLSSFLTQTEEYLHKLGSKITAAKNQQEVVEAASAAAAAARTQGLSEEEVRAAASCAGEEVMIRNRFYEMNAPKDCSSANKYYSLAHAVTERVVRQPSMLRAGTLRDYQLVGLQWMLSLYNNKLNGILADEMGLGKTVQVMALIAYLMEFKGNYGPHLIIVPNAVLVNWKSEFHNWLPSVSCIFYVGGKDQRSKLFSQEVCAMKFNVLVTTYEFIMYDRSKLSKVDWKYIIIDEAQRMKDRESVLARDLDRYRCQRRLLLTGTPLQNDLKELWSLLNLLLPEVFDNRKAFHDWFSKPFQREGSTQNAEDDWLETEKKVIIIHRLHQILEPFMLRRRVEDVEGSLPPKVSIVLRCRMSAIQGAIYDWIKSTGTLRVDPEEENRRAQKNAIYQVKEYKPLNNRCMELRKTCNHPLLNYPYFNDFSKDFLVRSCGKLWILDRILIKLQRSGHRVLLFSTMTKLLDILEEYLQWRRLDRYMGSIESLIRNNIQQYKIDMADEVINAGRFDQRTTHEERRMTLETLLHDEERYQETVHDVPSLQQVNRMIARSEEEVELFDQMDEELDWAEEMTRYDQVPKWLRTSTRDVNAAVANISKKPYKSILYGGSMGLESNETDSPKTERKRGRKGKKFLVYTELDDENGEFSEASYEERNAYSVHEEEGEGGEYDDDEFSGAGGPSLRNKDQSEEDGPAGDDTYDYLRTSENTKNNNILEEAGSSGSSSDSQRLMQTVSPISSQKFGSLSALEARPSSISKRIPDELEEGEIAVSGDSHMDLQQSGSWIHDRDEGEDEQVLQPKIKRKRSIRVRPRLNVERLEEKLSNEKSSLQRGDSSHLLVQMDGKLESHLRTDPDAKRFAEASAFKHDQGDSLLKKRNLPSRRIASQSKLHASTKSGRSAPAEDSSEHSKEGWEAKGVKTSGSAFGAKMSEIIQRRCKSVISKVQKKIEKEGHQIVPLLMDLWKRSENSGYTPGSKLLDLQKIDQRIDRLEYNGVMDFVFDVQLMLKSAVQYFGFSHEVRNEARKVQDLFFDIMKVAFPDTDFRDARNAGTFSSTVAGSSSAPSPRQLAGQTKRHKWINEVVHDPSPTLKPLTRGSASGEDSRIRSHMPQKESRLSSSSRDQGPQDESPLLTHPGELVICKKKRKDREKSVVKPRTGSSGPVSPSMGRIMKSPGSESILKDARISQQWSNQSPQGTNNSGGMGTGSVGWANPVKRMRTDAGKRRPSHL
ncbi:Glutamine-Leucine-Glutamine, QLQ [Dillenia turbinata]|uniref:Glutamine-Leucine-Glutamine, QLQ n=1 Tax=Dillenia turbinata TaxID=194707 RepID=A0AAN8Z483_9MAGN